MPPHSEEPEIRSHGVDAMSHAYLQYPPFRCDIPGALGVTYDDGNKVLLVPTAGKVYSWSVVSEPPGDPAITTIKEGPILGARFSLDSRFLAILRSNTEVEFVNRETGASFKQPCKSSKDRILGLFWTDCPDCDLVFVTTGGLELYALQRVSVKLVDRKRQDVSWFIYTHESRLVLLASGPQCKTLSGYQFSTAGIIKVPKFEANLSKADTTRKPVLASEDVHIATMYGRLYCLQVDSTAKLLHMYRFYRDAVAPQGSLPVYASNVSTSVVDNVLLVHQRDSKVVLLYDILEASKAPITAPLPLFIRGSKMGLDNGRESSSSNAASLYGEGWVFLNPDLLLDHGCGLLWKIKLDLEAVTASSSDVPSVLRFLQRRRQEGAKAKQLCVELLRSVILEKRSLSLISTALSVITTGCSHAQRTTHLQPTTVYAAAPFSAVPLVLTPGVQSAALRSGYAANARWKDGIESNGDSATSNGSHEEAGENSGSIRSSGQLSSPVLWPLEVYEDVFAALEEEMTVEGNFLAGIIIEYIRCASLENLVVPPELHVLLVDLLVRQHLYDKLYQLVSDKILEPSERVALQLLKIEGSQNQQLGMDMLKQCHAHKEFISHLLRSARVLEALRYIRQNKLEVDAPTAFLEAAATHDNHQVLFSVLRFLCDFVPGFQQTQDFEMYYSLVKQNSA